MSSDVSSLLSLRYTLLIVFVPVLVGAVIGAALSGAITDRFGRKKVIIVTALLFAVGAMGASLAPSVAIIVLFRLIIGVAIGVASYAAPLYISEISPPQVRGALVSLNQLMITCGIVVSYLVDYAISFGANEWRWMFGLGYSSHPRAEADQKLATTISRR